MNKRQIHLAALAFVSLCLVLPTVGDAHARDTEAREAIMIDFQTGSVLLEKNPDTSMPPASMSKIMTVYIAFEELAKGTLSLDDTIPISEKAWRKGGSKMFVDIDSEVKVADILRGIIVQSGNDAAIALAEAISGSEAAFAEKLTAKAAELGLTGSRFRNATGWPDPEHRMTARDLAVLAIATIRNFPEYYPLYSETEFTYNDIKQRNRNPLLYSNFGGDGFKTGHTRAAGYGLTASVVRDGRRLILVINGLKRVGDRTGEAKRLIEWGFREFNNHVLFEKGETAERAAVWLGAEKTVRLVPDQDVLVTLKRSARRKLKASVHYDEPVPAPIAKGQRIATLKVTVPGKEPLLFPLVAGDDVAKLGVLSRAFAAIGYFVWGPGD